MRGNTGAIREEIGAFISLSSVHLACITDLSLYSDVCVCAYECAHAWNVLAFGSHLLANSAHHEPQLDEEVSGTCVSIHGSSYTKC